jgi:basic membrane protein A
VTPRRLILLLLAVNALLIAIGLVIIPAPEPGAGVGVKVGLVFDIGGKNDKSFNTAAWRGLLRAQAELGIQTVIIEPSEGADRETALRRLAAKEHCDLVIGVGFIFSRTLEQLARQFPDVKFAGIDYAPTEGVGTIDNLAGLVFREHEGAFLVGAIAGYLTHTKVVGFVGGMKIPLIRKFEAGYEAGVHHVCPDCRVVGAYAGSDPKAFTDAPFGQELASAQIEQGADIIFHAAGKTGDGMFAAVREHDLRAIGVDSDQYEQLPCCLVTSMLKRVDVAVVDIVKDVIAKKFRGGLHELGLKEDGVGFVANERNARLLPLDVVQKVRGLAAQIIAGTIKVPST